MPGAYGSENLTLVYSDECKAIQKSESKGMLPILIVLFVISYAILTLLVVEQGRVIESQRSLIREMLKDSTQLAALKDKLARDDGKQIHKKTDLGAPAAGAKGSDRSAKRPGKSAHAMKALPEKPAADLEDVRRSTGVI